MKKAILSALFLTLGVSATSAQAAVDDASIKAQLDSQKELVRDHKFYPANNVFYTNDGIFVPTVNKMDNVVSPATALDAEEISIKAQLDSQKELLRDYKFYPATNVFYTTQGVILPSFKTQLDSQKDAITDYKFYPANNVYYTDKGVYAPSVKMQLDSQKNLITDYKFYQANDVSYN